MHKLFFDKWKDDRYFLKDRTPYSLLENKYQGYGHTFHYNDSKEPEEICFEWVRFVSTLFLNVSDVKKKIGALKYSELHAMHYMCRTLLEKSSLDDYYKIMNFLVEVAQKIMFCMRYNQWRVFIFLILYVLS